MQSDYDNNNNNLGSVNKSVVLSEKSECHCYRTSLF